VIVDTNELAAMKDRACTHKEKMGPTRARNVAATMQLQGEDVRAYHCCFCPCWHVAHVMSQEGVEKLAEAIRLRAYPQGPHVARGAG
jgi:hypothetical protein